MSCALAHLVGRAVVLVNLFLVVLRDTEQPTRDLLARQRVEAELLVEVGTLALSHQLQGYAAPLTVNVLCERTRHLRGRLRS